jgi:hypothetical protein
MLDDDEAIARLREEMANQHAAAMARTVAALPDVNKAFLSLGNAMSHVFRQIARETEQKRVTRENDNAP